MKCNVIKPTAPVQDYGFESSSAVRSAILSVGREDQDLTRWLALQLEFGQPQQRRDAMFMLAERSKNAYEFVSRAVDEFCDSSEFNFASFDDLVAIGRHHQFIRLFAIEMAKPSPPIMKENNVNGFVHTYDAAMWMRGFALESFRHLADYFDEFKQVLLDAMYSFEEYDPDLCYHGPHGRISDILTSLGTKTASIAVPFSARLTDASEQGEYAKSMLGALSSMGAGAIAAIPNLQQYRESIAADGEVLLPIEGDTIDEFDDPVGAVMQSIYRAHQSTSESR